MDNPDWSLTRSFLAVAETGSLSAAARLLCLSQPTLGRHIADLEAQLGLALFTRQPRGLALTESATALLPHARAMRDAAAKLSLAAAGRGESLAGAVRITASRVVAHHLLPPMLAQLRAAEPGIEIDLVPTDSTENLLFREADIAVRMYRPTQLDVITTHLCEMPLGLYAAHSYLAHHPAPQSAADLLALDFVGFDRSDLMLRMMRGLGIDRLREDFPVRCDDQIVYWNLVRAGCGVGGMQRLIADADPTVARVADFIPLPSLPVWLTAAQALRQSPRIRRVFDHLAASFRALKLDPTPPIG
jgi:DNA-binding transcriptional LysR family regulator